MKSGEIHYIGHVENPAGGQSLEMQWTEEEAREIVPEDFLTILKGRPNRYSKVQAGNARDAVVKPPNDVVTTVPTFYQQADQDYCLLYAFASGLRYCGFVKEAQEIANYSNYLSFQPGNWAIQSLEKLMETHVPIIGCPIKYNKGRQRKLSVEELINNPTPYPTLVIPVGRNGYCSHCICVVDDLIFDPITPFALRLHQDSFEWIFGIEIEKLHVVRRFCKKSGKKGTCGYYNRKMEFH